MVDPRLVDLDSIPEDVRVKIVRYVTERKGVSARELGYTPQLINMIKHGKARVSNELLSRCLVHLTNEEYARLVGRLPEEERASIGDLVKVIRTARIDARFRELLLDYLHRYLGEYVTTSSSRHVVTDKDVEEFVKSLKVERRSEDTIKRHLSYLRKALSRLNFVLSPDGIRDLVVDLLEESESVARHTVKALKKFIKTIIVPKDPYLGQILYHSIKTIKPKANNKVRPLTIDEVKAIFKEIPSIEAKVYFLLLAECGLRPSEPFLISLNDVDFERGYIRIGRIEETKREFVTFLHPETAKFIKEKYLPVRDEFVRTYVVGLKNLGLPESAIGEWQSKLIPFDRSRLRREIKDAARKILNREFNLYELRKFFSTYMIMQGVPETIVNTLTGKAPPREYRVLVEHYWSPRHEELRRWYLEKAPKVCC